LKANRPRGIAVLDIGATNVKAHLFDADLNELAAESIPAARRDGPPYSSIDAEPIVTFAEATLPRFDRELPVDAIVPCAHGSALALMDASGGLSLPIMCYEAQPPPQVVDGYANIAPAFTEVFAPTNPMALTLGRQLYWQETLFPGAFASTSTMLPLAQYLTYRLCGSAANEVSAMGAQTHLWAPLQRDYSAIARQYGWASRFPTFRSAWEDLGRASNIPLRGHGKVLTGVHDSNANLLPFLGDAPFALLSTGTWVIGFANGIDIRALEPAHDQVSNTTIFGDPVASCRFMGGREFEILAQGAPPHAASSNIVAELLARGVSAWPAFTTSGGPVPNAGGKGHVEGIVRTAAERASLASLYCAQMSALALKKMGVVSRVIVDGPFSINLVYLEILAACLPGQAVLASGLRSGTALGAASLALMKGIEAVPNRARNLQRIAAPLQYVDNSALRRWFERVDRV